MWRAVTRAAPHRITRANAVLAAIARLSMDDVAPAAEVTGDKTLRSLGAIHLATAHEIRTDLSAFVCYDERLRDSAHALGLPVETPPDPVCAQALARGAPNWMFYAHSIRSRRSCVVTVASAARRSHRAPRTAGAAWGPRRWPGCAG
jgi:hypothetical protein